MQWIKRWFICNAFLHNIQNIYLKVFLTSASMEHLFGIHPFMNQIPSQGLEFWMSLHLRSQFKLVEKEKVLNLWRI